MSALTQTKALVSRGPFSDGKWGIEPVKLRELKDDEVLVEIVASGICHTDLHCGNTPDDKGVPAVFYPRVLGHEGSGYVKKVGSAVSSVKEGDAVLLSFSYCGECHVCKTGPPSHCTDFFNINFMGNPVFTSPNIRTSMDSSASANPDIGGRFFGQSSFARQTIVSSKSVVNVSSQNLSLEELRLLAPLGCGLQTGAGTVQNVAKAGPEDAIAIIGLGGVGLAAVMAAKNAGCRKIIGLDRLSSRLALARELGATDAIDTSNKSIPEVVEAVKSASDGLGATIVVDTSAHPPLVDAAVKFTRYMARIIQVGTGMPESYLNLHMQSFMVSGKQYFGAVQGHSRTAKYIPELIQWWRDGKFPVEKLIKSFDFEDFGGAIRGMGDGSVVKPVLVWKD
ncbi:putative Enoyl reductase (ER) domain-containing protein [Seiridium cardinale]|uniref:Enoyl reductase (ER) domain-containing protein n=1 Tax=Seiridium cardinale TaxID=138064 RepID=A0ABR2XEP1_9PEZI